MYVDEVLKREKEWKRRCKEYDSLLSLQEQSISGHKDEINRLKSEVSQLEEKLLRIESPKSRSKDDEEPIVREVDDYADDNRLLETEMRARLEDVVEKALEMNNEKHRRHLEYITTRWEQDSKALQHGLLAHTHSNYLVRCIRTECPDYFIIVH